MVDEATNLIMEQLRILRRGQERLQETVSAMRADLSEVKVRMSGFELNLAHLHTQIVVQNARMDRIEGRLEGIERHLDLTHA
jgi:predicted  nucleic acid-binding Zn-ribbon protein